MSVSELNCNELVEIVTAYLEGALPPSERTRFEAHLAGCTGCSNYLDQMRRTIRLAGTLTEETISDSAKERLLLAFRTWKSKSDAGSV